MASEESRSSDESSEERSVLDEIRQRLRELEKAIDKLSPDENNTTPWKQKTSQNSSKAEEAKRVLDFSSASPSTSSHLDKGNLLNEHPWAGKSPLETETDIDISMSGVYTLSDKWCEERTGNADMKKIYSYLPMFIMDMKKPSSREALQYLLKDVPSNPHITEIIQEQEGVKPGESEDKPSKRTKGKEEEERFKAFSSLSVPEGKYCYLDCEYMLKMFLPNLYNKWFKLKKGNLIRAIKEDKRWIFTPSYRRAKIALLDWPEDEIITQDSTIRILVVRPFEFEKYVEHYGQTFPVISLPQEEVGAGYARFWIQKIALRLKLPFIWMIDDSVECFYEYHPKKNPDKSYTKERRLKFGRVFERIEKLVKDFEEGEHPVKIAAMSPRRWRGKIKPLKKPFVCKAPQCAVFLNLFRLKEKEVYYRPELQTFEDMVFAYECVQNGLKVVVDNRIHLQDHHHWSKTGARSACITQKQPEA